MIFYTIHCTKCEILQKLLKDKNIDFQVEDNPEIVNQIAAENCTDSVPFAIIDGQFYNTKELQGWIKEK